MIATPLRSSDALDLIRKRGTVVVGVKTDYPPFGRLDASGNPEGFEHDLAQDIARRLGVTLTKVSVTGANRLQKLEEGAVDMVIATTGDTGERRRIATMVEPNYYASGVTLLMRPEQKAQAWTDIRGQRVCAAQGSYFNRPMGQRYLLDLVMFNNARDAKLALRDGRCIGFLFDNTAVQGDLALPEWAGYKAPLAPAMTVPWAIAIARREQGTLLEKMLGDAVADWHRTGFLIQREKAWGLPPARFLQDTQKLWLSSPVPGQTVCARTADGQWPSACRNPVFLTSGDVGGLRSLGLRWRELTGMDLTIVYDSYDRSRFLAGLLQTVVLMLLCTIGSLSLGVLGALLAEVRVFAVSQIATALSVYARMTPPLLLMYLLFFGAGAWVWATFGVSISPLAVAVWCLSYYTGASVMAALVETANHQRLAQPDFRLRLGTLRTLVDLSSGPVTAALVNVSKATMMASVISVPELLATATAIMSDNGNIGVMMNALLLAFLVLIAVTVRLLAWAERRLHQGEH